MFFRPCKREKTHRVVLTLVALCFFIGILSTTGCGEREKVQDHPIEEETKPDSFDGDEDGGEDLVPVEEDNEESDEPQEKEEEDMPDESTPVLGTRGNHPGNYNAPVLEKDGWIYYSSFPYENVRKVRIDGGGAAVISSDMNASCFNMLDNWLYYVCNAGLVKLGTNGEARDVLFERPDPYHLHYLNLVDGWFYFALKQHEMDDVGIFKLPLAGGEPQRISHDEPYSGMCVADGWIYYSHEGIVFGMRTDGSEKVHLENGFNPVFEDGWLYYTNEGTIYRTNPEDFPFHEYTAVGVDLYSYFVNVLGDQVYYVNQADGLKPHRLSWGSGGTEVVADDEVSELFIYEAGVYYKSHSDWRTYRVIPGTTEGVLLP